MDDPGGGQSLFHQQTHCPESLEAWNARPAPVAIQTDQTEVVDLLKAQVQQLQDQLAVKDGQLSTAQGTLDKQMLLLEHEREQTNKGLFRRIFGD